MRRCNGCGPAGASSGPTVWPRRPGRAARVSPRAVHRRGRHRSPGQRHPDRVRLLGTRRPAATPPRPLLMAGSVNEIRVGGGFGQSRTAVTGPVLVGRRWLGEHRRDVAVLADAEQQHVEVGQLLAAGRAAAASSAAYRGRGRLGVVAGRPVRRPASGAPGPGRAAARRAARPAPGSRCGPGGRPAGSARRPTTRRPGTSRPRPGRGARRTDLVDRGGDPAAGQHDRRATPRAACASTSRTTSRAATAAASTSGSAWTTTPTSVMRSDCRRAAASLTVTAGAPARRVAPRPPDPSRCVPGRAAVLQPGDAGQRAERLGVDLVGVQPAQLLGQLVAQRPAVPAAATGRPGRYG